MEMYQREQRPVYNDSREVGASYIYASTSDRHGPSMCISALPTSSDMQECELLMSPVSTRVHDTT
jgi:hypothetical protein